MKFSKLDGVAKQERSDFYGRHQLDARFAADNWPMLLGEVPMGIFLARYELLKRTLDVPGHIVEFGSFNGTHLVYLAKMLNLLSPHTLKKVYGFDSFEGLNQVVDVDQLKVGDQGNYKGNLEFLREVISSFNLDEMIELQVGYIEETLPVFLKDNPHAMFSYIYMDTDLYQSTALALELCWSRLMPGGIVAFDEGYHDRFPGEGAAAQEFLATKAGQYRSGHIPFARQPMFWVEKI